MPKKICLFGDSISKGVIIDPTLGRYTVTKRSFANILSCTKSYLNISNFSMLGCTIQKGQSLINRHIKDVQNCDLAVLEYGGNDSDHNWAEIAADPDGNHLPKTPVEEFAVDYCNILDGLQSMGKSTVILNLPPIDEHKYFSWFARGLNGDNILKWLGGSERYIFDFHKSYNSKVCEIAAQRSIPMIDIRSAFLAIGDYSSYLCDDGIHPNEKGHKLIADVISEEIPDIAYSLLLKPGA